MAHPDRPTAAARSRDRLVTALGLTAAFFVVEVLGALWTGSLALLADAGHMLTDVGGTALALFAIWIAGRPPTPARSSWRPTGVCGRRRRCSEARCSRSRSSGSP